MQLHNLSSFLQVAERQSFSAAAAALGVSRSAVSQAVRALEAELGVSLLVRTTRSVRLTDAGARLFSSAAPALRAADDALAAARGDTRAAGNVRLTVPSIAGALISAALPALRARYPDLAIEIAIEDRLVDIVAEGYDAGIRLGLSVEKHMIGVRISAPFRFVVVGAPAYLAARGTPVHPRDLLEHDCLGYRAPTSGRLYRWEFERRGKPITVQTQGPIITTDAGVLVRAAADGLGLAYVDEGSAAPLVKARRLVPVLEDYLPPEPGFALYFPERARTQPKIRALVDVLRVA